MRSGKVILTIIVLLSFSGLQSQIIPTDFSDAWKRVENFSNKGLPKSALEEVNRIYLLAKKGKNETQVIKALLYKISLNQNITEESFPKNIDTVQQEISISQGAAKAILQSIAAEMYLEYFQQQRWKLYNRTKTVNFKKADIQTWGTDDFHNKIGELYLSSLQQEHILQQSRLEPFDAIIIKGNVRYLRPTLYDLLAHRALEYFKSDEKDVSRPSYAFEITDERSFAPIPVLIAHKFENKDSVSLHFKALTIFQKLIAFHKADADQRALIDVDLERLLFVRQYAVMTGKDELYLHALEDMVSSFPGEPGAEASYLLAQLIFEKASLKNSKTDTSIYTFRKAKELAETVSTRFPETEAGTKSKTLLTQILHKSVNLTSEKVNLPGTPFRTMVSFKNVEQIYLRVILMTPALKKAIESNVTNDELWNKLVRQEYIRSWKQVLPFTDDYREHSVEIKIDALPVGQYALLSSAAADFNLQKNPLSVQYFHVSGISYINSGRSYFILDRSTGESLAGAKVQVWKQHYDYESRRNALVKSELLIADKHGLVKVSEAKVNDNSSILLDITYREDKLFLDDYQYSYNNYSNYSDEYNSQDKYDRAKAKIFFFTDRSIYRPGQLVYFKGIGITQDFKTKKNKVLSINDSITFYLSDANGKEVDSLNLHLNDYGSCNGKFHLPTNTMNGDFSIHCEEYENSSINISVEEYKRPKFHADFEKVKGTYHLNDSIKVTGFAKAYAGNNIDGAKVKYKVSREARFPYSWMFWWRPRPASQPLEITNGEAVTSADGKFNIVFLAIPDLSVDKATEPVFDYKVEADVTDINGETRSSEIIVPVGYKALNLQILVSPTALPADSFKSVLVSTKNLSGEFERSKVDLKIYKLLPPPRLIRKRFWSHPDKFIFSKEEYISYFPNDEYDNESVKETWPRGEVISSTTDSTNNESKFQITKRKYEQGWYVAEANSTDRYGEKVKDIKYFELYDLNVSSLPAPTYSWNQIIKNVVDPGNKATFLRGSTAQNINLIEEVDKPEGNSFKDPKINYLVLNNEKKVVTYPVTEDDRGGYYVHQFFVKDNRFYSNTSYISVPWTNKELTVSFDTYRDKLLPGSEENWKVNISGVKGDKVAAEMLVSMYDASLDQFKSHSWQAPDVWPTYRGSNSWNGSQNFSSVRSNEKWWNEDIANQKYKVYDELMYGRFIYRNNIAYKSLQGRASGIDVQQSMNAPQVEGSLNDVVVSALGTHRESKSLGYSTQVIVRGTSSINDANSLLIVDGIVFNGKLADINQADILNISVMKGEEATALYGAAAANGVVVVTTKTGAKQKEELSNIKTRKNFNETAFFFPELQTNKDGNISFSFTMPEALTQWKLQILAHTKGLAFGTAEKTVITQKELMVQPFAPRFLREGDKIEFTAKINNLGSASINGAAQLQLFNASTMKPVDSLFKNNKPQQKFTIGAGQSTSVKFSLDIPVNYNDAIVYKIVAKSGDVSDGEEASLPVLSNRMLVTETMPLPVRGTAVKTFTFDKLLHSGNSTTLTNYSLTTEFTSNPAWYAIQALPYLIEFPYECAEQTFNRFYANSIASKIINSSSKIKAVFDKWKITDTAALVSNLQKNQELKSVLLEETPWVTEAKNETQQKKNIALLFDMVRMNDQLEISLSKLKDMQSSNGGFVWFKGGTEDRYITQYIVTGVGHLIRIGAFSKSYAEKLRPILLAAIPYLDKRLKEDYDNLIRYNIPFKQNNGGSMAAQYLYMRSFFPDYPITKGTEIAYNYYMANAKQYWLENNKYCQAMIALALSRSNDNVTPSAILRSLKENSINNEELGMYWKEWNAGGYYWYQAPIESQSLMIEAFTEIGKDLKVIDDLKTWLLKNKQTNNWHTTKATAEACYALLLQGTQILTEDKNVEVKLGNMTIKSKDENQEAGTGYFKKRIDGSNVSSSMGNIVVTVSSTPDSKAPGGVSWGAVYWQYFENLDKITFSETPLKLKKHLFRETNTDRGPVLTPIEEGSPLKVGDKIKVRIELRVDRQMEYVHMKDMRASCMEPVNVISSYKYQGGLGYYESTKDASTNFFFSYLPVGVFVFEYPMFVTHSGNFSNGITSIQCMYAPEFTAHSEGIRVKVSE